MTEPSSQPTPGYDPTIKATPNPSTKSSASARLTQPALPPEVGAASSSARFGKFVRTQKLGAGGMGEVWKAWDVELGRWVALKFLKGGDEEEIARFKREAQTAGKLSHPNIAAVYEVGEAQGRHYIAMQFVEGQTLKTFPRGDPKLLARLVRDAARAVAYAHEQGVVHRDLKPENLMVTSRGKGPSESHVYVMDFGLARATEGASELSVSGTVVGTPSYMPPEQARGERVDNRADVYSLGATLYELVTDRVPFRGANVYETLRKVQDEEPRHPRKVDPRVDSDLETIVLKCLEKEKERRYAAAAELADDLDRWLEGEAILGRRASLFYRWRKRIAKRKGVAWTVAGAVAIVAVVLGVLVPQLLAKQALLTEAQRKLVDQMRVTTDACLEAALALRRTDRVADMEKYAKKVEEICLKVSGELPHLAEPHYRVGRIYRAQMRYDDAWRAQAAALKLDPTYAPAVYERLVLGARRFRDRLRELEEDRARGEGARLAAGGAAAPPVPEKEEEAARRDAAARAILDQIAADLATLEAAGGESAPRPSELACARALKAWVGGDADTARSLLSAELAKDTSRTLDEAHEALGRIESIAHNDEAALKAWTAAVTADPGCVPHWIHRGRHQSNWGLRKSQRGEDPGDLFDKAVEDCEQALRRDPASDEARAGRGIARLNASTHLRRTGQGENAEAALRQAIEDLADASRRRPEFAEWLTVARMSLAGARHDRGVDVAAELEAAAVEAGEAIARDERRAGPWTARGYVRFLLAKARPGGDPVPVLQAAAQDFTAALQRDPTSVNAWFGRAAARQEWGEAAKDPAKFGEAVADLDEALKREPQSPRVRLLRGITRMEWGQRRRARGDDPAAMYRAAEEDLTWVVDRHPGLAAAWTSRGMLRVSWAAAERAKGADPEPHVERALADFAEALKRDASDADAHHGRGLARWHRAKHAGDAVPELEAAVAEFGAALGVNPRHDGARRMRGAARLTIAQRALAAGQNPTEAYVAAIADFDEAIQRNASDVEARSNRALANLGLGEYRAASGAEPFPALDRAVADCDELIKRDAMNREAWLRRGQARILLGAARRNQGADATGHYAAAVTDLDEAAKLGGDRGEVFVTRAAANFGWGTALEAVAKDPRERYEAAVADAGEALKWLPESVEARLHRGGARATLAAARQARDEDPSEHYRGAIEDLTEALKRRPGHAEALRRRGITQQGYAMWLEGRGQDGSRAFVEALKDFEEAAKAGRLEDRLKRGEALVQWGLLMTRRQGDPMPALRGAVEEFASLAPRLPAARARLAYARFLVGQVKRGAGEDPTAEYRAAIADADEALKRDAKDGMTWAVRGDCFYYLGVTRRAKGEEALAEDRSALDSFRRAVKAAPGLAGQLKGVMEELRARVEP